MRESGSFERLFDSLRGSRSEVGLIALLGLAIVGAVAVVWIRSADPPAPPIRRIPATPSPPPPKVLVVHVTGQVTTPGVYEVPEGSRVKDAIRAAAGPKDPADLDALNLAAPVGDGQKIRVPKPGEAFPAEDAAAEATVGGGAGAASGKVDLNQATAAELEELPGVGPVLAQRILEYRRAKGAFKSPRQLMEVSGFGPKRYESLKDLISV